MVSKMRKNINTEIPVGRIEDKLYCADGTVYFFPRCMCVDFKDGNSKAIQGAEKKCFSDWLKENKDLLKLNLET